MKRRICVPPLTETIEFMRRVPMLRATCLEP